MRHSTEATKRSVESLQRLYTVVVSLAVAETLRRLFMEGGQPSLPRGQDALMAVSFLATVIPFYHGANRYLDVAYVTTEYPAKPSALMFDFVALFVEGISLFVLAVFVGKTDVFYTVLAALFVFDAVWVGFTRLMADRSYTESPKYPTWAALNVAAAILVCVSIWTSAPGLLFGPNVAGRNIVIATTVVLRTVCDYVVAWPFYFPRPVTPAQTSRRAKRSTRQDRCRH